MAKKKKKDEGPWDKFKFIEMDKYQEYDDLSEDELIETLKKQQDEYRRVFLEKKNSEYLKEMKKEISEYRKGWAKENPQLVEEKEQLQDQIKTINNERDAQIESDLEEKAALEGGMNDSINGAKEHILCITEILRKHS